MVGTHGAKNFGETSVNLSWESIRKIMSTQQRVRVSMPMDENQMIHVRTTTKPEVEQKIIYEGLGMQADPIGSLKTIIERKICSAN